MKEIEQAANNYSQIMQFQSAFAAGAEFAQQWIQVSKNEIQVEVPVIIKTNLNEVYIAYYLNGEFHTIEKDDVIELDEVVGWRPINLK